MTTLSIDIETYSDISLPDCGVYKYADSPSFKILLFAYAVNDDPVQIVDLANSEKISFEIKDMILDPSVTKTAFNAQFERVCLSKHLGEVLDPIGWECTMIKAHTLGYSGGLDQVSKLLGFEEHKQKLFTGKNLIRLFSIPRKPTKANGHITVYAPTDKPEEWQQFKEYCVQDVVVEREIRKALEKYTVTNEELKLYEIDQRINDRGVMLDLDFADSAIKIDEAYSETLHKRYVNLTGLENPKSVAELKKWLSSKLGENVTSITKDTMPKLIKKAEGLPEVVEALKIRQEVGKTSVTKYKKMQDVICSDGRARGLLQFYGANRTGRWAGRLIQVQNLPQNKISDLDLARQTVADGDGELLEMLYGNVPNILSQLIRTAIIAPEGHRFIVADFSAIEARVIAWLAGERWRMDVFNSHGKIYEASASQMFKVPVDQIDKGNPLRQKGKISELALGYQGSVGALKQMGALEMGLDENELPELVDQWRNANSKIVKFWYDVERAAKQAVADKTFVAIQKGIKFVCSSGILFIQLPSGRRIAYQSPRIVKEGSYTKLKYMGQNQTTNKWVELDTYGGKLVENIVQATARDCLRESIISLEEAGFKTVMHVHDEVIVEIPDGESSVDEICNIMSAQIAWAKDLPLTADGYECKYYQKD